MQFCLIKNTPLCLYIVYFICVCSRNALGWRYMLMNMKGGQTVLGRQIKHAFHSNHWKNPQESPYLNVVFCPTVVSCLNGGFPFSIYTVIYHQHASSKFAGVMLEVITGSQFPTFSFPSKCLNTVFGSSREREYPLLLVSLLC